jgi:NTP pyrophosphatase (non-canonical NTP hydrolase)
MEFRELVQRAMQIREQYAELEKSRYGRSWTDEEIALGFMGDVGDLAKLILAREGVRAIPDAEAKLAHELADCLWSVIVLAEHYSIDLEKAFMGTMDEIEVHIKMEGE